MITRINIVKENSEFKIQNKNEIPKNWILEIKNQKLFAISLSNANLERDRINEFNLEEGSLFLFNSSRDFYCYFRKKEIQDIFDQFNIVKMISISDRLYVTLHIENGKVTNPITHINGFNIIEKNKSNFKITDGDKEYFQVLLILEPTRNISEITYIKKKGINNENQVLYLFKDKNIFDFQEAVKDNPELYNNNQFIFE